MHQIQWIAVLAIAMMPFNGLAAEQPTNAVEIFQQKCFGCHDSSTAEGELDLESLIQQRPLVRNLRVWKNIATRIELGDMPPADSDSLSDNEQQSFAKWYQREIEGFDYESIKHPGYEPVRRLTHIEYRHTIRDLVGVNLANTDRFPQDLSGQSGFENSANTLFLQSSLLEKYIQAAEAVTSELFAADASGNVLKAKAALLRPAEKKQNHLEKASAVLIPFASRAFRHRLTDNERDTLKNLFVQEYERHQDFEGAIQKVMTTILVMPQFLLKVESQVDAKQDYAVDDFDLASRLSYFLWGSTPDRRLLDLAWQGKLTDPETLDAEIERMLQNRRAKSLGYVFAAQWLGFDDVGVRRREDPIDNPWCTESLMTAMRAESALFFYSLIRDNHRLPKLIDARYTYLNEELARHYRIRGIEGSHMRPVRLQTPKRGGILTHASVLSVTAFPDRTSPVNRGKWVLDTILGTPPPEPPPNVSEISEDLLERDGLSFREMVEAHSQNAQCRACHQEMDPLGFSLENYDNFGRWRSRRHGERINATGRLPDGTEFTGAPGLKEVLVNQRLDDLTRQLAEKMLTYALGRQLEYYDEAAIRKIVAETKANDYRFRSLLKAVIHSYPFRFKRRLENQP